MENNLDSIKQKFNLLQRNGAIINESPGWYASMRKGPTGIGFTFEELMEKQEDNLQLPDFGDYEIKTTEEISDSPITLFTATPDNFKRGWSSKFTDKYGYNDDVHNINRLMISLFPKQLTPEKAVKNGYQFKLVQDEDSNGIKIEVYDDGKIIKDNDLTPIWFNKIIEKRLNAKLKKLIIVNAKKIIYEEKTYYKYNSMKIITNFGINNFLDAFNDGKIFLDLRIGIYESGGNYGKRHDHGSGFRIKQKDLIEYSNFDDI